MLSAYIAALFSIRGILTLVGLIALGLVIWFGGPYLSLWGYAPLAGEFNRAATIIGLLLTLLLITLVRYLLARRANQRMIKSLMDSEGLISTSDDRSQEEVELIRERFEDALKVLRE